MAPHPSPAQIASIADFLRTNGNTSVKLDDVMELATRMAESLDEAVANTDALLHGEFRAIASEISTMKSEINALRPNHLRFERIPEAGQELDAVVEATEDATQTIMTAAEDIMSADASDPDAYKAMVDEKMILIFEACTFQDITGQRVRKVVKTLAWIEQRIGQIAQHLKMSDDSLEPEPESDDERRMRELILHGPQMKGDGVKQSDVDDFFTKSDQDDIDKLFD